MGILSFRITVDFKWYNVFNSVTNIRVPLAILRHVVMKNFGGEFLVLGMNDSN
jgi:hypothetical protein